VTKEDNTNPSKRKPHETKLIGQMSTAKNEPKKKVTRALCQPRVVPHTYLHIHHHPKLDHIEPNVKQGLI
jgi:hypothetical protein